MGDKQRGPDLLRALFSAALVLGLCLPAYSAPQYKVLHVFTGGSDGSGPWAGVVLDQRGNLYGTTPDGGDLTLCGGYGCGVVFELTPHAHGKWWSESVLRAFGSAPDGTVPYGGVALDSSGNLYGTTEWGGTNNRGTAFELTPSGAAWSETILYSFCSLPSCQDGGSPSAAPTPDASGNLYGTAGIAYELSHDANGWTEAVLHAFTGDNGDGYDPFAGVILDEAGNLYGTTAFGGIYFRGSSGGTVYELKRLTQGAWKEVVLHRFRYDGKDGTSPGRGALFMDGSGNLYGTTQIGGSDRWGTIFKLAFGSDGRWTETILYNFRNGPTGGYPGAGVVMDKLGGLYGTTVDGGAGCGVIYKLTPGGRGRWKYTVLHTFEGIDGCIPAGNLVIDQKGNLYGGTILGGTYGNGLIFQLTP